MKISMLAAALALAVVAAPVHARGAEESKVREAIASLVPDARIDSVRAAPIEGYQEVVLQGQVVYVSNDGTKLIQGMIFDIPSKTDLTEVRRSDLRKSLLAKAPDSQRIAFKPKGEVKHRVAVFTDIDCGFCRELHKHMEEYNARGVEVDYLFFPRAGVGSESFRKAVAVWCAKDQQTAMTEAKAGKDPGNASCVNPIEAQYQLGQQMGITGTPTLIFPDGSVAPGYVTPDQLEARLTAAEAKAGQ